MEKRLISLKAMLHTIKHEGQGVRVELRHLVADCVGHQLKDSLEDYPTELAEIMGRFQQLFHEIFGTLRLRSRRSDVILSRMTRLRRASVGDNGTSDPSFWDDRSHRTQISVFIFNHH